MANIIQAKFNGSPHVWNPLDPNNWEGGVVPGKNDVARFKRFNSVYSSYENNNYIYNTYDMGPNHVRLQRTTPHHFNHPGGYYTASVWTDLQSQWSGVVNNRQNQNGSSYPYGGSYENDSQYHDGYYYYTSYVNAIGRSGSYNGVSENQWYQQHRNSFDLGNTDRWPNRFFMYAMSYRLYYNNRSNTSFTVDGVTISESDGLNGGAYASASRPYGISKADYLAAGGQPTMVDRMVDLFTGSALHVSNGGRWQIRGPHNGRGYNPTDAELNTIRWFTIFTVTGSEYRNSSYNSGPSFGNVSAAAQNMIRTQYSSILRMQHALGYVDSLSGSANSAYNMEYPIWFWDEGTSSLKYARQSGSANSAYHTSVFATGSGHFYGYPQHNMYQGFGPGNDMIRFTCEDNYYTYGRNIKVDPNWGEWSTSESVDYPLFSNIGGTLTGGHGNNNISAGQLVYGSGATSDNILQRWELTGSQLWEVGRIEMAGQTHLHVKDNAHIKLYDLEDSTYYPSIDIYDYAIRSTLLLTDSATIETTSSRTSVVPGYESGIYQRQSYTSVIISGSANYSSSVVATAASEGDTTIEIDNVQNTFGVGDYITLQSTGSYRVKAHNKDFGLDFAPDPNDISTWFTASFDTGSMVNAQTQYNQYMYKQKNPIKDGYNVQSTRYIDTGYTHTIETDEIVQIASMSGDYVTVAKMYGKEGEIQLDQGLFSSDLYAETFGEASDTLYTGNKRVVLVDSSHRDFQTNDVLVISGSAYKVLHSTTFLSQSLFREFTSSNQPPLDEVFDLLTPYSASSIWPTNSSTYGVTQPSTYFGELFFKERLLITGSYRGTNYFADSASFFSNAYNNTRYGGASGSNAGYKALQLDPTLAYTWQNAHPSYRMDTTNGNSTYTYRYHAIYSTNYVSGEYQLLGTDDWEEGEIVVSGSILRNGLFDHTSSIGHHTGTYFGFTWGGISQTGASMRKEPVYNYYGDLDYGYISPYPYNHRLVFSGNYGGRIMKTGYNYSAGLPIWKNVSGSNQYLQYNNPAVPYRYAVRNHYPSVMDDLLVQSASLDMLPLINNYTASWRPMTASMESQRGDRTGGTGHIKVTIQDGVANYYLGSQGNEVLVDKFLTARKRGRVALNLRQYGSIYSVNVKTRWQQLILDTDDSFNYRDKIKEGGLLNNHYAGKESKFVATEVVDAKGFKNLLWDAEYNKGASGSIRPYMYAVCHTGTTAGSTALTTNNNAYSFTSDRYQSHATITPRTAGANSYWSYGQNNDNYYIIYDFRQPVTYDTIGVIHCKDSYQYETNANNQMNDVSFEVCDDVGVESPSWVTVRASADDLRQSGGRGDIRFYTFPSGSVSARYIKWKNRGGTSSANYRYFQFFGAYNFSGSCAESGTLPAGAVAGGFAAENGGPTASMCQVELANVKNFSVNDYIFFWSKQTRSPGHLQNPRYNITINGYKNVSGVSGYYDKSTSEDYVLGGFTSMHKIIAITGNIVTLDKPITHEHIGAGTMAYKVNRGKVQLIGDRAAPFYLYTYSSDSLTQKVRNVTFINGSPSNYNANQYNGQRTYEDVGAFQNQENNLWQAKPGLLTNIVASGFCPNGIVSANFDNIYNNLVFNTISINGSRSNYAGRAYLKGRSVLNFNVMLNKSYYGYDVNAGENFGSGAYNGTATITNNFLYGDYRSNYVLTGGVRLDRNRMPWSQLDKMITVKNNVIPMGMESSEFLSQTIEGYTMKPYTDRYLFSKKLNTLSTNQTFFFPSYNNNRMRGETYGEHNNITLEGTSASSQQKSVGDNPVLVYAEKVPARKFGNRNFILLGDYYQNMYIVKGHNFNNDGLYEMFSAGDYYPNQISGGGAASFRPIYCNFNVNENNTQVRIDFDMIYKTSLQRIYGASAYSNYSGNDHNFGGESQWMIIFENAKTRKILDVQYLNKSTLETISKRDIYTLDKGKYSFYLYNRTGYYIPLSYAMDFKNLNLRIVTPKLSDITIEYNNFDFLKLFDSVDNYTSNNSNFSDSSGINRVLKQSSDLGGTTNYKFNKIKL